MPPHINEYAVTWQAQQRAKVHTRSRTFNHEAAAEAFYARMAVHPANVHATLEVRTCGPWQKIADTDSRRTDHVQPRRNHEPTSTVRRAAHAGFPAGDPPVRSFLDVPRCRHGGISAAPATEHRGLTSLSAGGQGHGGGRG